MSIDADAAAHCLRTAGLDESAVVDWIAAVPDGQGFDDDQPRGYPEFWQLSNNLVRRLAAKTKRNRAKQPQRNLFSVPPASSVSVFSPCMSRRFTTN